MRRALLVSILIAFSALTLSAQVKVWEATLPLPASDEGPPDENPNFDTFAQVEDYPYTMREDIRPTNPSIHGTPIYLENEYLKCTILPQLGGTSTPALTRSTASQCSTPTHLSRKASSPIAAQWSAFGEEFNFPVSHNWVTISPWTGPYRRRSRRQRVSHCRKSRSRLRNGLDRPDRSPARQHAA